MMTKSSSLSPAAATRIDIAASARKIDVNNRIPLRFYFRIADNVLKQADIFRDEDDIIDLYVMLLRFSSLVTETIPRHREYRTTMHSEKYDLKKKLLNALSELEDLKPLVQRRIEESNRQHQHQVNNWGYQPQNNHWGPSNIYPPSKQQISTSFAVSQMSPYIGGQHNSQGPRTQQFPSTKPFEEQFRQISLNIPRPREETLSRHSIFGPNGLHGQWQPPPSDKGVRYPSNIDFSAINIPSSRDSSAQKPVEDGILMEKDDKNLSTELLKLGPLEPESKDNNAHKVEEPPSLISFETPESKDNNAHKVEDPASLISFETMESHVQTEIIRQPSPPPVLAEVQDLIPCTPFAERESALDSSSPDGLICAEAPLELHISTALMDSFMRMAKSNTDKNLETCGVLAGSLKNRKFSVTALIIPKQESTSDSCQTTNEEEIFEVQDKQCLFPLGWIHTHPTQSCFMSSIDVHTQYSYQIMLPESIAIVMAPRDSSRTHGIFRLTTPGGMNVIRQCPKRGFHAHDPPSDGSPIYKQCTDVYMNNKLKFDIIDLR